jgi:hypothetical protein
MRLQERIALWCCNFATATNVECSGVFMYCCEEVLLLLGAQQSLSIQWGIIVKHLGRISNSCPWKSTSKNRNLHQLTASSTKMYPIDGSSLKYFQGMETGTKLVPWRVYQNWKSISKKINYNPVSGPPLLYFGAILSANSTLNLQYYASVCIIYIINIYFLVTSVIHSTTKSSSPLAQ